MKKALKIIGIIILVLILAAAAFLLFCFFSQRSQQKDERTVLASRGYCNMVSAGDIELNVPVFGSDSPDHSIVCLPGSGDCTFAPAMKNLSDYVHGNLRYAVIERPGYGLSDNAREDMTAEYVVESSRKALASAGIEAPYILMPHSLGGIYAEYWLCKYPEEVEGVLFLDTVYPGSDIHSEPETFGSKLLSAYCAIGLERMFGTETNSPLINMLPEEYRDTARRLMTYNPCNSSLSSEAALISDNLAAVEAVTAPTDCPKLYISTNAPDKETYRAVLEYEFAAMGAELTDDILDRRYEEYTAGDTSAARSEHLGKLGNVTVTNIPASHFVYDQYPEKVAEQLEELIGKIA